MDTNSGTDLGHETIVIDESTESMAVSQETTNTTAVDTEQRLNSTNVSDGQQHTHSVSVTNEHINNKDTMSKSKKRKLEVESF